MSLYGMMRTGVSGMNAQANKLGTVADNIANVNTTGYKRASTEFSSMVMDNSGTRYDSGSVQTDVRYAISEQGPYLYTTSKTDIAIKGNGFFYVMDPDGKTTYLTRAGSFVPTPYKDPATNGFTGDIYLVNSAGNTLLDKNGAKINLKLSDTVVPPATQSESDIGLADYQIDQNGNINAVLKDGTKVQKGQLAVMTVPNPDGLQPEAGDVFTATDESGTIVPGNAGENGAGTILSSTLETSNVDLGTELTEMISAQRSYTANSKVFQTGSDLLNILVNLQR